MTKLFVGIIVGAIVAYVMWHIGISVAVRTLYYYIIQKSGVKLMKIKSWWQYLIKSILIMDYKHYIGWSLFVVLPVMLIHLVAYENGIKVLNIFATVLYLVYWMVYGFYAGYKKAKNFLIFNLPQLQE